MIEKIGAYTFIQEKRSKVTEDSFLLSEFVLPLKDSDTVIDLGAASGIIPFILASKSNVKKIVGVEADESLSKLALKNIENNNLKDSMEIINRDWRELKGVFPEGSFTVILSNPPYIKLGEGRQSPYVRRRAARYEVKGALSELVEISSYLAGDSGRIFYVYPVKRLLELLEELEKNGLQPVRISFVHTGKEKPAKIFLIEAGKKRAVTVLR